MNKVPKRRAPLSRELGLLIVLVVVIVLFRVLFPYSWENFATFSNFAAVVRNITFEGILAIGMMLLLIGGTFDLSVGALASLVGVVTGWLLKTPGGRSTPRCRRASRSEPSAER